MPPAGGRSRGQDSALLRGIGPGTTWCPSGSIHLHDVGDPTAVESPGLVEKGVASAPECKTSGVVAGPSMGSLLSAQRNSAHRSVEHPPSRERPLVHCGRN